MDIIYPLGKGSRWTNLELLYSIASVKKHLKDHGRVYVIGEHPGYEYDFIHIPHSPKVMLDKDTDICDKVAVACRHADVSDDFVFMNDDVYFNRDMACSAIPETYIGMLQHRAKTVIEDIYYRKVLLNTSNALLRKGLPEKDFDGHMPIVFNKKKFLAAASQYDWRVSHGFAVKSIYFNTHRISGVWSDDLKISKPVKDIPATIGKRWCFSIGDNGLTAAMKLFLKETFAG
ncbi:MAG: hypothetical protein ACTHLE_03565 [Agriterribacter sp.]